MPRPGLSPLGCPHPSVNLAKPSALPGGHESPHFYDGLCGKEHGQRMPEQPLLPGTRGQGGGQPGGRGARAQLHLSAPQHPFMELRVLENNKRSRRNLGLDCDEHSTESRCCRYPLTVDFEAFGWDWIIAPKRYKANYCSGQCEYMFMQKYPHTHLVQQANPRGSAGPCCTPTKMSPINMLYFNDKQQIIYGKIPGMVVDRCGCS